MLTRLQSLLGDTVGQGQASSAPSTPATYGSNLPIFLNGSWNNGGLASLSPDLQKFGYVDPWQAYHQGTALENGRVFFSNPTNERIGTADVNYGFATGPNQSIASVTSPGSTDYANADWVKNNVRQGVSLNGQQGFTVPVDQVPYLYGGMTQTNRDNGKYAVKQKGGLGLGGLLGLASIAFPALAPWAAGLNVAEGVANGNIGQAIGGALGLPGVGNAVTGSIGSALTSAGVPASIAPFATKGLLAAGTTALTGGGLQNALTNGLASGLGSYAGNQVAGGLLGNGTPTALARAAGGLTNGAIGGLLHGQNPTQSAMYGGINGLASGAGYAPVGSLLTGYLQQQQAQQQRQRMLAALSQRRMA